MINLNISKIKNKSVYINTCETDYFNQLNNVANKILDSSCRIVLLCGPSGSGKTTTGERLCGLLKKKGIDTLLLSMDNWYATRKNLKRVMDENGNIDYESPYCVDIDLFNHDLNALLFGESVNSPRFDFTTGTQEITDKKLSVSKNGILIVEGLHAFNDYIHADVRKIYVYVSPDSLYVDNVVKIFPEEIRLYRRLSRDKLNRGRSFNETIKMWDSVECGTIKYLNPNLYKTDVTINSLLDYEIFVHRNILGGFQKLSKVQNLNINIEDIPKTSILNEFFKVN